MATVASPTFGELLKRYRLAGGLTQESLAERAGLVPQAVAAALGVAEQPGQPLRQTLTDFLRPRRVLLVLDNCEHMLGACAALAQGVLTACPHVRILATSRAELGVGDA